jgi:hypothetical protein
LGELANSLEAERFGSFMEIVREEKTSLGDGGREKTKKCFSSNL